MSEKTYWLKCETTEGMFPDEMGVLSRTIDGQHFSLYANLEFIKEKDQFGENLIKVFVYDSDDKSYLIKLPADPFETRKFVSVANNQIEVLAS